MSHATGHGSWATRSTPQRSWRSWASSEAESPKLDSEYYVEYRRSIGFARFMRNFHGDVNLV
eukprot:9901133-Heterocapsa_arctica.AAC.1